MKAESYAFGKSGSAITVGRKKWCTTRLRVLGEVSLGVPKAKETDAKENWLRIGFRLSRAADSPSSSPSTILEEDFFP